MYLSNTPFLNNEFTTQYYSIINSAQNRNKPDCYCEEHHIIPKCMNGTNNKENLVVLTGAEHFIVHKLLIDMTIGKNKSKMLYAFKWMMYGGNEKQNRYEPTPEEFQYLKTIYNTIKISDETKNKQRLSRINKIWVYNEKDNIETLVYLFDLEKYILMGYVHARRPRTVAWGINIGAGHDDLIRIYNEFIDLEKNVREDEVNDLLSNGYKIGGRTRKDINKVRFNTISMYNEILNKVVWSNPSDIIKYIEMGYRKGTKPKTKETGDAISKALTGKISMFNKELDMEKHISPLEEDIYILKGFKRGTRPRKKITYKKRKNIAKKITIYNEKLNICKMILLDELPTYLEIGYKKGRRPMTDKCLNNLIGRIGVYNSDTKTFKKILPEQLDEFLLKGYCRGGSPRKFTEEQKDRLRTATLNRIKVFNKELNTEKTINSEDVSSYLNQGYILGRNPSRRGRPHLNQIVVYNKELDIMKYIVKNELELYISQGYILGRKKTSNKEQK